MNEFINYLVMAVVFFAVSFLPSCAIVEIVIKLNDKKLQKKIRKIIDDNNKNKEIEFDRIACNIAQSVNSETVKHLYGNIFMVCMIIISISFVIGYYFCKSEMSEVIEYKEYLLEESEKDNSELRNEIKYELENVEYQFYFMEDIYGYNYIDEALRYGEINYSELVEMYKYATKNIQNIYITFSDMEEKFN